MHMHRIAPSAPLAAYVECFQVLEPARAATRTLVPETGLLLGVRYAGQAVQLDGGTPHVLPHAVVTGLRAGGRRMATSADMGILLVRFLPGGASALFDTPLHALFGRVVSLEALAPRAAVARLTERVGEASAVEPRIAALEDFLRDRLARPHRPDPLVQAAVQSLVRAPPGGVRIAALARALHLSQDALEKRFRRVVGASPRRFASLVRLRRALALWRPGARLGSLALDAGYYDQAHLNREFRAALGVSPGRYFAEGGPP